MEVRIRWGGLPLWIPEMDEEGAGGTQRRWQGISVGKGDRGMRDRMKEKVSDELEKVNMFFKHYKRVNDSVSALLSFLVVAEDSISYGVAPLPTCPYASGLASAHTCGADGRDCKTVPACDFCLWSRVRSLYTKTN